jgi:hypothetical protein
LQKTRIISITSINTSQWLETGPEIRCNHVYSHVAAKREGSENPLRLSSRLLVGPHAFAVRKKKEGHLEVEEIFYIIVLFLRHRGACLAPGLSSVISSLISA